MSSTTFYNLTNLSGLGTVTAATFSGSGASLTSLPMGQVTGILAVANGGTGTTTSTGTGSIVLSANPTFTGIVTATTFSGSGASLTNLPMGQATGILGIANGGTATATTSQNYVFAGPTSGSGAPSFRTLGAGDLPASGVSPGTTGSSSVIPVITYDTYGRLTSVSSASFSTSPLSGATTYAPVVASGATTITSLSSTGSIGQPLLSGGNSGNPSYGTLGLSYGGTGQTTAQASMNSLAGAVTNKYYLRGDGANVTMSAIQAADVPTLNQNTTGTATGLSATLALTSGGTGQTSAQASMNVLAGSVLSGRYLRGDGTNVTMSAIQATDLPVSGVVAGSTGSSSSIPVITYDTYGRLTSVSSASVSTTPISGATTYAPIVASGASSIASLTNVGATGQPLLSGGSFGNPSYGTLTIGAGGTGQTSKSQAFDALSPMAAAGDLIYGGASGTGTRLQATASGTSNVLHGGTIPSWGAVSLTADVSGILPVASGGTGQTSAQASMNVLAGAVTSGYYLRGNGTNVVMSAIQAADVPTLNQNTTGFAGSLSTNFPSSYILYGQGNGVPATNSGFAYDGTTVYNYNGGFYAAGNFTTFNHNFSAQGTGNFQVQGSGSFQGNGGGLTNIPLGQATGILPIGNGGTSATTKAQAFDALSPMAAAGDLIYGGASGTGTRLATGTATQILHGGTTPSWGAVSLTADVSGTLPVSSGGTGTATTASLNSVFAGPGTGGAGAPSFRALVAADLPVSGVVAGSTGSSTIIPVITYDTYGRLTSVTTATVAPISGATAGNIAYAATATTLTSSTNLTYNGTNLTCAGDIIALSDRNVKTNIELIPEALEKVSKISGYTFNRTDGETDRRTGVIAQEVREVLPEAVYTTENGTLGVAYGNMVGLLIEALKEEKSKREALEERLSKLEKSKPSRSP